jgi:hypothetical protein
LNELDELPRPEEIEEDLAATVEDPALAVGTRGGAEPFDSSSAASGVEAPQEDLETEEDEEEEYDDEDDEELEDEDSDDEEDEDSDDDEASR